MESADYGLSIDSSVLIMLQHVLARSRTGLPSSAEAMPGPIATRRRGRGSEPDDIRVWALGDDIRHIDRNTTARTGVPHVKTFREEREQTTLLLADFRPPMLFGTRRAYLSVVAAELLCLCGWRAAVAGGRVGLLAFGAREQVYVKPSSGNRGMLDVIGGMVRAHPVGQGEANPPTPALADYLNMAGRLMPRGGTAILASSLDERGSGFEDSVRRILHRSDVEIALLQDPFKERPPRGRFPFVTLKGVAGVKLASGGEPQASQTIELDTIKRLGARVVRFQTNAEPHQQLIGLRELHGGSN